MAKASFIESRDGYQLFFRERMVESAASTVVLIHGFAEHSGRYGHVMDALEAAQINVLACDLRGHGKSQGKRGYIDSFSQYIDDVKAAVDFAKKKYKVKKIALMAHSMGALIATHYAAQYEQNLCALVLSSPLFGIRGDVPKWKTVTGRLMSRYYPSFSLANSIRGCDLTHDVKLASSYDQDPLIIHHVAARWFTEVQKAYEEARHIPPHLKIPLLLQLSNMDRIVDDQQSVQWYQKCAMPDKKKLIYDGFFHEIYNEIECARPIADAVNWLKTRDSRRKEPVKIKVEKSQGVFA